MNETINCRNGGRSRCILTSITQEQREANRRELEKVVLQIAGNAAARYGVQGAIERIANGPHAWMTERTNAG